MTDSWIRDRGHLRAEPESIFSVLYSFAGLSSGAVAALGAALVLVVSLIEQTVDLPITTDLIFVLIVGGVAFHSSSAAGTALAITAGAFRFATTADPPTGEPEALAIAAIEGSALLALLLGSAFLARALHRAISTLQRQATFDPVTGVLNKRGFLEAADRERLRSLRSGHPMTIAYFDIDGLKALNDEAGHHAGDTLLCAFAAAVADSIRSYDVFGRVGGDEFVLVLSGIGQLEARGRVARICSRLAEGPNPVFVSVGLVTHVSPVDALDDLLREADRLMYRAKRAGGNRIAGAVRQSVDGGFPKVIDLSAISADDGKTGSPTSMVEPGIATDAH